MEFVDGESLQQRLANGPIEDVNEVCRIAAEVAEGLAAAHAQGIIHRDVKPANILIEQESGRVKLTDFGLALTRSEDMLTNSGTLLGTPEYLAPEQIFGQDVDQRADIFSLGSVIYHMCMGGPPYAGNSIASTLHAVATSSPVEPLQSHSGIPKWLGELVNHLHAKTPDDRPHDAFLVAKVLRSEDMAWLDSNQRTRTKSRSLQARRIAFGAVAIIVAAALGFPTIISNMGEKSDPFVAHTSQQLAQYLEEQEGDLVIELASTIPYSLGTIAVEDRSLELSPGEGVESILVFNLSRDDTGISCSDATLELSGLTIRIVDLDPAIEEDVDDFAPLLYCQGGSLTLRDCTLHSPNRRCIEIELADGEIVGTQLRSTNEVLSYDANDANRLHIIDCSLISEVGILVAESSLGEIRLDNVDFRTDVAFEHFVSVDREEQFMVRAHDSRFACEALFSLFGMDQETSRLEQQSLVDELPFTWLGTDNQLPEVAILLISEEDDEQDRSILSEDWGAE